ncbi:MAG: hypothetical protein J4F31_00375 [Flavobacteriales bacterium]|nr:hypothetical protein [Flavobacteriales bacterium]
MEQLNCKNCNEPLSGRVDKRFCDDHCRNAYHNDSRRARSAQKRTVQVHLSRNYRILSALRARGVREVHEEYLRGQGFDDRFCTERSQENTTIVFDLMLERRDNFSFRLLGRQN